MPTSQCMTAKVAFNGAKNDALRAQQFVEASCPGETMDARIQASSESNMNYVNLKKQELKDSVANFHRVVTMVNRFVEISGPATEYLDKMDSEINTATKETTQYHQKERTRRRQFLDGDPQSGVFGLPGVRTYDDKVLLAFWITYGVAIAGLLCISMRLSGQELTFQQSAGTILGGLVFAYAMAYYMIYRFA